MESHYCLKWGNFTKNIQAAFSGLFLQETLSDTTIYCEGMHIKCHKLVLSLSSSVFEKLFSRSTSKHPYVILHEASYQDMMILLKFMYTGEASVPEEKLGSLLKLADCLKVKGLTGSEDEPDKLSRSCKMTSTSQSHPIMYPESVNNFSQKRRRVDQEVGALNQESYVTMNGRDSPHHQSSSYLQTSNEPVIGKASVESPLPTLPGNRSPDNQCEVGVGLDLSCAKRSSSLEPEISRTEGSCSNPSGAISPNAEEQEEVDMDPEGDSHQLDLSLPSSNKTQEHCHVGDEETIPENSSQSSNNVDVVAWRMRRQRRKREKNCHYTQQDLENALSMIITNQIPVRRAEKIFGVPESTLRLRLKRMDSSLREDERSTKHIFGSI